MSVNATHLMSQSQRPTETVAIYCDNLKGQHLQILYVTAGGTPSNMKT